MDDVDRAQRREEEHRVASLSAQRARAAQRIEPEMIDGVACCADCLLPLEPHRIEAGTCVPCKTIRERRARGGA